MDAQFTNHMPSSPWISVPDRRIICIEHPAIIQNLQNGINTLGGEGALSEVGRVNWMSLGPRVRSDRCRQLAASNGNMALHLRFRPDDPMQRPIESRSVPTNNILLKITIPRRRRKRRLEGERASRPEDALGPTHESLPDKLKASNGNYKVEAIGRIDKTVRFRGSRGH